MKVHQVEAPRGRHGLVKMWEPEGYPFEQAAVEQIDNVARMPFIHKHVAVMPDAHAGIGATVGTVIATKGAVIPAAVGVDIGCGMMAVRLSIKGSQLPDNLAHVRAAIERAVPHGRGTPQQISTGRDPGSWGNPPAFHQQIWVGLQRRYQLILDKHPKAAQRGDVGPRQMGTLGTGNHFIEMCLDEQDNVWLMLHSGSRGLGNKIGSYFIEQAKEEMRRYHILDSLPDGDLAYLVEHTKLYDDYMEAVSFAQDYASENRRAMMWATIKALRELVDQERLPNFVVTEEAVNCHHNYVTKEAHFGENVLVTRKGAVQAREGTLGIIPGSMGTGSFIVRGLGNKDSFCSCSHGAGRVMSRNKAKELITLDEHAAAMKGIEARLDAAILDESPRAYKPIGAVMDAQKDLVEILYRLRQIVNVKG